MKLFVTGGAGFIGSHIVDDALCRGWRVTVYDNLSSGTIENIENKSHKNLDIIAGDILDKGKLQEAMRGHDIVSHHAAQLEIFLAAEDPSEDLRVNTIGTLNVLSSAKNTGVSKVINISSACVYGQVAGKVNEQHPQVPNWDYGVSKLAAERYSTIYNDYKDLTTVNLRYGIVYGEREWFRRVLPIFVKRAVHGQAPVIFGDGKQQRDFINVKDIVSLNRICMETGKGDGKTYNVGSNQGTSICQIAEAVCATFNLNQGPVYENVAEGEISAIVPGKKRNTAELVNMLLDTSKAHEELSWRPKISLNDGLAELGDWYKNNQHRWEKIFTTRW